MPNCTGSEGAVRHLIAVQGYHGLGYGVFSLDVHHVALEDVGGVRCAGGDGSGNGRRGDDDHRRRFTVGFGLQGRPYRDQHRDRRSSGVKSWRRSGRSVADGITILMGPPATRYLRPRTRRFPALPFLSHVFPVWAEPQAARN